MYLEFDYCQCIHDSWRISLIGRSKIPTARARGKKRAKVVGLARHELQVHQEQPKKLLKEGQGRKRIHRYRRRRTIYCQDISIQLPNEQAWNMIRDWSGGFVTSVILDGFDEDGRYITAAPARVKVGWLFMLDEVLQQQVKAGEFSQTGVSVTATSQGGEASQARGATTTASLDDFLLEGLFGSSQTMVDLHLYKISQDIFWAKRDLL